MTWHPRQIEMLADYQRDTLMREAKMERLAQLLRPTEAGETTSDPRPQRRGLAILWPRLTPQAS